MNLGGAWDRTVRPAIGWADLVLAIVVSGCWGLSITISKIGVSEIPPLFLLAIRFALVAAVIVPWVRVPTAHIKRILVLSVTLGLIHFPAMFIGLKFVDASSAAIYQQLQTPFAMIIATIGLSERPDWRRVAGIALAFVGVIIVAGRPSKSTTEFGTVLMIVAAFFWALGSVQMKVMSGVSSLAANGWLAIFVAPQLFLLSLLFETNQLGALLSASRVALGSILYLAFVTTLLSYGLWYYLIRRHDVSLVMPFTLLVPIFGVASGIGFLGERVSVQFMFGSATTLSGLAFAIFRNSSSYAERKDGQP